MKTNVKINLKKIRKEKGMTQLQVCEKSDMKVKTKIITGEYGYIENGKRMPNVVKAIKIARALGTTVEKIWQL